MKSTCRLSMKSSVVLFLFLMPPIAGCALRQSSRMPHIDGPYIDSVGFRAARSRLDAVDKEYPDSLIQKAFRVQDQQRADSLEQPDFFQSIEEDYQRYRTLFTFHKKEHAAAVYCKYDLLETFKREVFDPQPFMNAILHALSMPDITTLSFDVLSSSSDRMIVRVSWSKAVPQENSKGFSISEGSLELAITQHWITLADDQ